MSSHILREFVADVETTGQCKYCKYLRNVQEPTWDCGELRKLGQAACINYLFTMYYKELEKLTCIMDKE